MLFELKLSNNIDVSMIKEIVQNVENQEHCDGVSWLDYKMHIRTFLKIYGVEFVF